ALILEQQLPQAGRAGFHVLAGVVRIGIVASSRRGHQLQQADGALRRQSVGLVPDSADTTLCTKFGGSPFFLAAASTSSRGLFGATAPGGATGAAGGTSAAAANSTSV